jgi:hypothetical protein
MTVCFVGEHELEPEEQETHLNMMGDKPDEWTMFTDDHVWITRMDKLVKKGYVPPPRIVGSGKEYKLRANQVSVNRGITRNYSPEYRAQKSQLARLLPKKAST